MSDDALATIEDVEARLSVELDETQHVRVTALLRDASAAVRLATGQQISAGTATWRTTAAGRVRLPQKPVTEVTTVTRYTDAVELDFIWDGLQHVTFSGLFDGFERDNLCRPVVIDVAYSFGYEAGHIPDAIVAIVCQAAMRSFGAPVEDAGIVSESLGSYAEGRSVTMQQVAAAGAVNLLEVELLTLAQFALPALPIDMVPR